LSYFACLPCDSITWFSSTSWRIVI
jgi:hypothetical protein